MQFQKLTLDCVLRDIAKEYHNKPAISFEGTVVSYAELYEKSYLLAANLKKVGIGKNDKVSIILPNCLEYIYIYFALFLLGAWVVPISTRYERDEIRNVLKDSDASAIIFKDKIGVMNYDEILEDVNRELPFLKVLIRFGEKETDNTVPFHSFLENSCIEELEDAGINPDDVALLAYTSGTTGIPKGVMISHKNLIVTSQYTGEIWDMKADSNFSIAPMYAAQGFLAILLDLVTGTTMKWISSFNPHDVMREIVKEDINMFHTQPTMWSILLSFQYFQYLDFSKLKKVIISGSLCTAELAKKIESTIGCTLINGYGLIEATGCVTVTHLDDPEDVRINTVGRPIPGVQVKIVDEERKEVKKGEIGELAVKGYLMEGYYKKEEKTKEIIDDEGWLYTGDLACYYDDGINIRIVGRCKDMIIRGGFNVYPVDIEECLLKFDKVEDVSVVGKNHEILGESIVAFVIPKPGVNITTGEVISFCRGKIANYKIPDEVIFVSQFPIIPAGKVKKNDLKKWAENGVPDSDSFFFGLDKE